MGFLVNSIGTYTFDEWIGEVQPPQENVEVITRKGVDGVLLRRIGNKGRPFRVVTHRYLVPVGGDTTGGFTTAASIFDLYRGLTAAGGVSLVRHSVPFAGSYQVLRVQHVRTRPIAGACGALIETAANVRVRLEVAWDLLGI